LPWSVVTLTASMSGPPLKVSQEAANPSNALTSGVALDMQPVRERARAEETRMAVILDTETTFFELPPVYSAFSSNPLSVASAELLADLTDFRNFFSLIARSPTCSGFQIAMSSSSNSGLLRLLKLGS
jgi:hypothetical protein